VQASDKIQPESLHAFQGFEESKNENFKTILEGCKCLVLCPENFGGQVAVILQVPTTHVHVKNSLSRHIDMFHLRKNDCNNLSSYRL
jgi:hypothetical protein